MYFLYKALNMFYHTNYLRFQSIQTITKRQQNNRDQIKTSNFSALDTTSVALLSQKSPSISQKSAKHAQKQDTSTKFALKQHDKCDDSLISPYFTVGLASSM